MSLQSDSRSPSSCSYSEVTLGSGYNGMLRVSRRNEERERGGRRGWDGMRFWHEGVAGFVM